MIASALIQRAAAALHQGLLVVAPTDTVYGVCAHPEHPSAIEQLFAVKGRPDGKPIPLLISGIDHLTVMGVKLFPPEQRLAEAFWPGPLTLVVQTPTGTEGVRVPDHADMRRLLQAVGGALRVTSANRSGERPALTVEEAGQALGTRVDMLLDGGAVTGGVPSSVVRVSGGRLDVLREGAIPERELRRVAELA